MTKKIDSTKTRIHELAKDLGLKNSKPILDVLENIGLSGKTASSSIEEFWAVKVRAALKEEAAELAEEEAAEAEKSAVPGPVPETEVVKVPEIAAGQPEATEAQPEIAEAQPEAGEAAKGKADGKPGAPEEEVELKVPERFKKDLEAERVEKFKAKPGMQRAFQAIRKVEPRKFADQRGGAAKKTGRGQAPFQRFGAKQP